MIDSSKRLAMGEGLAESNPVIGTNKAAGESKARLDELINKLTPPVASVAAAPGLTVPMSLLGRADEVIE